MFGKMFCLWKIYAKLDLLLLLRDWKYCLSFCVAEFFINVGSIIGVILLAERFDGIGQWNRQQLLFFLGYGLIIRGLLDMFFNNQILNISRRVGRGHLDHMLMQPQPMVLSLFTEGFAPFTGSWSLLFGLFLTVYSGYVLQIESAF